MSSNPLRPQDALASNRDSNTAHNPFIHFAKIDSFASTQPFSPQAQLGYVLVCQQNSPFVQKQKGHPLPRITFAGDTLHALICYVYLVSANSERHAGVTCRKRSKGTCSKTSNSWPIFQHLSPYYAAKFYRVWLCTLVVGILIRL